MIVVYATGKGLSTLLETRIQRIFPNIDILATKSYYQMTNFENYEAVDFVITTIPLNLRNVKMVNISNVLSKADIRKSRYLMYDSMDSLIYLKMDMYKILF